MRSTARAFGRRQLLEDFGLLLLGQVFEDVDRIVGIEIAHALGDDLGRQLFEDFLADRVVDLGQRGEVELARPSARRSAGRSSASSASIRSPVSASCRSPTSALQGRRRRGARSPRARGSRNSGRIAPSSSRKAAAGRGPGHVSLIDHAGLAVASSVGRESARLYARPSCAGNRAGREPIMASLAAAAVIGSCVGLEDGHDRDL